MKSMIRRILLAILLSVVGINIYAQTDNSQRWDESREDWYRRMINLNYDVPDYNVSRPDDKVVGWRTAKILQSLEKNYTQGVYNQQLSQIRNVQMGELQFRYLPIKKMKVTNIQKKDSVITVTANTLSITKDKEKIKCDIRFCFINSLSEDEIVNKLFCDIARYIQKEE